MQEEAWTIARRGEEKSIHMGKSNVQVTKKQRQSILRL